MSAEELPRTVEDASSTEDAAARINALITDLWIATERNGPRYDDFELSSQQHVVLGLIIAEEEPTAGGLADALAVTKGAISQHLAVLEREGYIARRRSERDGRVQVLVLRERGLAYRETLREFERYLAERYRARLSDEDLARIITALEMLKGAVTQD